MTLSASRNGGGFIGRLLASPVSCNKRGWYDSEACPRLALPGNVREVREKAPGTREENQAQTSSCGTIMHTQSRKPNLHYFFLAAIVLPRRPLYGEHGSISRSCEQGR